jgi:hypothetical protein
MDDPFIRQYVEDLLTKIRTQVRGLICVVDTARRLAC